MFESRCNKLFVGGREPFEYTPDSGSDLITSILFNLKHVAGYNVFCPVSYQLIGAVCGTDGVTYPSICDLENARSLLPALDVALLRPCNNYCTENWDPLCGSDMVTYANACIFANAMKANKNLKIFHHGQCLTPLEEDMGFFNEYKQNYRKLSDEMGLVDGYKQGWKKRHPKKSRKEFSETVVFA